MRRYAFSLSMILGVLALTLYGVIGETGPVGWLNAMQSRNDGHYSRVFSTLLLFIGAGIVVVGPLLLWHWVRERVLGLPPKPILPAGVDVDPPLPQVNLTRIRGLRYIVLLVLVAVTYGGTMAWHLWDWQRRSVDATSDYVSVPLGRDATPARPANDSHLELQGRLLREAGVVHRTEQNGHVSEEMFIPIVGADWREGDPVRFVAKLSRYEAMPIARGLNEAEPPLAVRVDGAVPGALQPVFAKGGAPVADEAVLVHFVDPGRGRPAEAHPAFDWQSANQIGGWGSAFVAAMWLTAVVSLKIKAWKRRRDERAGRPVPKTPW